MSICGYSGLEIIPGRLYFIVVQADFTEPDSSYNYLCVDSTLIYTPFFADFGPLDLGHTYSFCEQLNQLLNGPKPVVYYCLNHHHRISNAVCLICAYQIFVLKRSCIEVYTQFIGIQPPLAPFRDASFGVNTYPCMVIDCVRAMSRAASLGHFNYDSFSLHSFQHLKLFQNGDISWIIPGKFLAFSGPVDTRREVAPNVSTLLPHEYIPVLKSIGVTCIVRFNSPCYDKKIFTAAGIRFVDLLYEDGANPPEAILQSFMRVCELESGAIAVHCKAGLGRTGTNIAAYIIKHYGYTAREAIAWCRLCRPGSIVGPQQQYLIAVEDKLRAEGEAYRKQNADLMRSGNISRKRGEKKNARVRFDGVQSDDNSPIDASGEDTSSQSITTGTVGLDGSSSPSRPSSIRGIHTRVSSYDHQHVAMRILEPAGKRIIPAAPSFRAASPSRRSIAQIISQGFISIANTITMSSTASDRSSSPSSSSSSSSSSSVAVVQQQVSSPAPAGPSSVESNVISSERLASSISRLALIPPADTMPRSVAANDALSGSASPSSPSSVTKRSPTSPKNGIVSSIRAAASSSRLIIEDVEADSSITADTSTSTRIIVEKAKIVDGMLHHQTSSSSTSFPTWHHDDGMKSDLQVLDDVIKYSPSIRAGPKLSIASHAEVDDNVPQHVAFSPTSATTASYDPFPQWHQRVEHP